MQVRCRWAAAAAWCAACVVGCFAPDYLTYTPCATSEGCADAGLAACVRAPEAEVRGFCTVDCDADATCPMGQDGDATPRCATIGEMDVCVLACGPAVATCPMGQVCVAVTTAVVDGDAPTAVCFPEAAQ